MILRKAVVTAAVLAVASSCAPRAEPGDTIPRVADAPGQAHSGTVRVVGSAPVNVQVVLQPDRGGPARLSGPLSAELARLAGAQVVIYGPSAPSPDPLAEREIEVERYDIVAIDGRPAVLGEVVARDGESARLRTDGGEEILLSGAPSEFRVGQRVWVQGPRSIVVQAYGTVRP